MLDVRTARSTPRRRVRAASSPRMMPTVTPMTIPAIAMAAVAGSASPMMSATERPGCDVDSPRSPRNSAPT